MEEQQPELSVVPDVELSTLEEPLSDVDILGWDRRPAAKEVDPKVLYDAALVEAKARAAKARALELAQSALPPFARNPYKYLGKGRWLTAKDKVST